MNSDLRRRAGAIGAVFAVLAGGSLMLASPASANEVWHQAIGSASADATCPTNTAEETAAGWSEWAGSWQKWMNGDTGGYVCQREITWAYDTPSPASSPASSCIVTIPDTYWLDFTGTDWLSDTTQAYGDSACSTLAGAYTGAVFVLADTPEAAQVICDAHGGGVAMLYADVTPGADPRLYYCSTV